MNMAAHPNLFPGNADRSVSMAANIAFGLVLALTAAGGWAAVASYKDSGNAVRNLQAVHSLDPATVTAMSADDRQSAIDALKARLQARPLDNDALTGLAILLSANGDKDTADKAALIAASRTMKDEAAQLLALDVKMKQGDIAAMLVAIDGLVRSSPKLAPGLFDQLLRLSASTEGQAKLVGLLAQSPPWREAFFARATSDEAGTTAVYGLMTALRSTEAPPSDAELRGLIARMFKAKDFSAASYLWLDMLSEPDLKRTGNVFDSGFESQPRNLLFDWTVNRSKNVEVKFVPRATGSADQVLRVDYVGNRDGAIPVMQYVRLTAGDYVFSGEMKAENLKSDSGILWQVQCVEGAGGVLALSPKLNGNLQWSRFDMKLTVPEGCTTQLLTLQAATRAKLDQQISGMATFDNITINGLDGNE